VSGRLAGFVHVDGHVYGPGDDIPPEVARRITNPAAWAEPPTFTDLGKMASDGISTGGTVVVNVVPRIAVPPRSGPGSGRSAWVAYAQDNDVEVTDDLKSRDDVIAACELAGVPTE
jgi:hypothetical protein